MPQVNVNCKELIVNAKPDPNCPGWYYCDTCKCRSVGRQSAEDCCRDVGDEYGRHSAANKKPYLPKSKKPDAWV